MVCNLTARQVRQRDAGRAALYLHTIEQAMLSAVLPAASSSDAPFWVSISLHLCGRVLGMMQAMPCKGVRHIPLQPCACNAGMLLYRLCQTPLQGEIYRLQMRARFTYDTSYASWELSRKRNSQVPSQRLCIPAL